MNINKYIYKNDNKYIMNKIILITAIKFEYSQVTKYCKLFNMNFT